MKRQPETQEEVDALYQAIRFTKLTDDTRATINNLYKLYINPSAERCNSGCGKIAKYQDELNKYVSLNNQNWKPIQDAKREVTMALLEKTSTKEAKEQIEALKNEVLKDKIKEIHPKRVQMVSVDEDGFIYVNRSKTASYIMVDDNVEPINIKK